MQRSKIFLLSVPWYEKVCGPLLWSDEVYFHLNGAINRHNCINWSTVKVTHTLSKIVYHVKLCVWLVFYVVISYNSLLFRRYYDIYYLSWSVEKSSHFTDVCKHNMELLRIRLLENTLWKRLEKIGSLSRFEPIRLLILRILKWRVDIPRILEEFNNRITHECSRFTTEELSIWTLKMFYKFQ